MSEVNKSERMKKELSLFSVFALSTGTTLSAGFFLLPGLATDGAGPAMILCYLLAAVPMFPAILSILELSTAMPRSGGAYYFLDRSLGPLMGLIGGFGTWTALVLKTAFALVGMGAYITLLLPWVGDGWTPFIASGLALFFGMVNLMGARKSASLQIVLVILLLIILAGFIGEGSFHMEGAHFTGFFEKGIDSIISTAGMVYISYVGVTKVASVSEEVKDPERNLPRGILLSFATCVIIYGLGTMVMVGVAGPDLLVHEDRISTPVATAAEIFAPNIGRAIICAAAIMAFFSVANAGILSASRYPMAMARDHLIPTRFRNLSSGGVPVFAVLVTTVVVLTVVWLPLVQIVKLASATQLLIFSLLNLAVIVMRESRIEAYDPGFKSPFYPWTQIVGIILPFWFIGEMGFIPIVAITILLVVGGAWYAYYARSRVVRHGAIFHVFERLGRRRFVGLDRELRSIMKEKGLRADDPFDELIETAKVVDLAPSVSFESVVDSASKVLARDMPVSFEILRDGFLEGTRVGATPVSGGIALPHLRRAEVTEPHLVLVRSPNGVEITVEAKPSGKQPIFEPARALFFLVSPEADPGRHLRTLAQLAERVDEKGFLEEWAAARDARSLRDVLIRQERYVSFQLLERHAEEEGEPTPASLFIGKTISELALPQGCLIVIVHRDGQTIVPQGSTRLQAGDRISVIGNPDSMSRFRGILRSDDAE